MAETTNNQGIIHQAY